ncbi:hypothetical protein GH714_028715 [Hevea brasiliensis]|uniref:Uncharacterized protein n=1 Tax=Hevea brasiliensis TaxID=3981 RepID=A0A6A6K773_HEVBR|nr:hypothetical protein GH714_028715 [Hevea brasiliensis]
MQGGRPIGSQEGVISGGMDASMVFENNQINSEYAKSNELFSATDSKDKSHLRVKADNSLTISLIKAWRAREHALKAINGDEAKQYNKLHDFKLELLRISPGNTMMFKKKKGKFQGIYICLAALKAAFKDSCIPLICLDGFWLKGTNGGQLLSVVGIDPNLCIFPTTYAVVLIENKDN